jgi:uncharacterized protein (DUF1501 family)
MVRFGKAALAVLLAVGCNERGPVDVAPTTTLAVIEARATPSSMDPLPEPVLIVTLDGVRWQEVFEGTDPVLSRAPRVPPEQLLPNLYAFATERGALVGAPGQGVIRATGPEYVSLPGYTEILGGRGPTACTDNACARTSRPTLLDEAHTRGAKVAAFASWGRLHRAITARPGAFFSSCGRGSPAAESFPGAPESRPDRVTAAAALTYFETERPDVFYLGLGDSDEHAHQGNYTGYIASIRYADEVFGRLLAILARDERGRNAHVVVSSDHGRAKDFRTHGGYAPEAARVWLVAGGPRILARGRVTSKAPRRLADIAPTLRFALGWPAQETPAGGVPIDELFAPRAEL